MPDIAVINSKNTGGRALLIAVLILSFLFGWFAIRWQIAIMLSSLTPPADPNAAAVADLALEWAPADPASAWLKAATSDDIRMYEQAVRLSPYDYRWHMELGRVLEQDDQTERAETEIKKAVDLAPFYASPRWQLGNFYLRQNRIDEALAELKKAAADNRIYRDQVFSLAWDYFDKDPAQVENLAGERPAARARLAYFFASRGRADDSLRNWNLLSDAEKAANPEIAKSIAHGLFIQRRFPQSLEFSRQLGLDPDARPEAVTNGNFEKGIGESPDSRFGWQVVRTDSKLDIATDSRVKTEGNRSLRVVFKNYVKADLYNLFQTIVVEPNRKYRLLFRLRTENLKSAGGPLLEIVNANDDQPFAISQAFPAGTNDWREMTVDFTAPENCSGITIRTTREACGLDCPITGTFWYDNFEISRQ